VLFSASRLVVEFYTNLRSGVFCSCLFTFCPCCVFGIQYFDGKSLHIKKRGV